MTFPQNRRAIVVEMYINGVWTNITKDVQQRGVINITRGKANEASQSAPAFCSLMLNNGASKVAATLGVSGCYSPRNPMSPYYGLIGRNTPIRVSVNPPALLHTAGVLPGASTPDSTALSVTGDLDVRIDLTPNGSDHWDTAAILYCFIGKADSSVQRSWTLEMASGNLMFKWTTNGSTFNTATSTADVPAPSATRRAIRVTMDVDNGAGGNTVTFYTSDTINGSWTMLGSPVVTAGVTSIFDSTSSLSVSRVNGSSGLFFDADWHALEVRNGIGGTVVSAADFSHAEVGASTYPDPQGNLWTVGGAASFILDGNSSDLLSSMRAWNEVSSFPPKWDTSGRDAYVPIEAAGISRRLSQGVDVPSSGLRDVVLASTGLYNYWPLTGGAGTTYSLDIGGSNSGSSQFYAWPSKPPTGPTYVYGSEYGSGLGTGLALTGTSTGYLRGDVGSPYAYAAIDLVFQSSSLGNFTYEARDYSNFLWSVNLSGGVAQVSFTDPDLGPVGFSPTGALSELTDGAVHHLRLEIVKNGTGTDWVLYIDGVSVDTGSQASYNLNGISMVRVYYTITGTQTLVNLGHIAVWSAASNTWPTAASLTLAMNGYTGETAGDRAVRICAITDVPLVTTGVLADSMSMGVQFSDGFLEQMREIESTDRGVLFEPRDSLALAYRTRTSLYNQTAVTDIDVSAGQLAGSFEPIDDDQLTKNDIFCQRRDGGSFRATKTTGALSILAPPNGVGRYKDEIQVNVANDDLLVGIANWLLHLGTIDEARYPTIKVDLANPNVASNPTLSAALLAVDIGDRITISNARTHNIYDQISLLVLGYKETLNAYEHTLTFNCVPESPYRIAVYGTSSTVGTWRYDTDGSELQSGVNSTATSLAVVKTGTALWTNDANAFPFDINVGGERITVQNITGSTSPQTFSPVVRSVNGVVKSQSAGAEVWLWDTPRYGL